ncbi:hypothetical protein WMF27_00680 [Sorangium sp. So ce281]|uniref:hypothetical protein n=1 Tax=Sorangium sp. So ce281 TaxID=3133293 RepID=UPI003F5E51F1
MPEPPRHARGPALLLERGALPRGLRCARTSSGEGACIPPYFLFQLRVDGHAVP